MLCIFSERSVTASAIQMPVPSKLRLFRQANAERSRRRRAAETPEQRAERNRKTAERMREKRAEVRQTGVVREKTELTADRFEEIFQVSHGLRSQQSGQKPYQNCWLSSSTSTV